ncbi:MAG: CPBP family intramembrane metalloprotease, partial [Planctomycetota bacterium]|nr:CPBP family intramembrane metalloprotease [Planctomycetota bacterium]
LLAMPIGIWIAVLPGQLFFFGAAVAAAWLSPVTMKQRLRLVRGEGPLWHWAVYVAAVPVIGIVTSLLLHATGAEWSDQMRQMSELMVADSGLDFAAILLLVAIVPGLAEEFLFRGYLQSRLLKRWRPAPAIGVSAAIFAIAHVDPIHVVAVLPLGIWLGLGAWRVGSIWPAVLCHIANNCLSVISLQGTSDPLVMSSIETMVLLPSGIAFLGALPLRLRKHAEAEPENGTNAHTSPAT